MEDKMVNAYNDNGAIILEHIAQSAKILDDEEPVRLKISPQKKEEIISRIASEIDSFNEDPTLNRLNISLCAEFIRPLGGVGWSAIDLEIDNSKHDFVSI